MVSILIAVLAQIPTELQEVGTRLGVAIDVRQAAFTDKGKDYSMTGDKPTEPAMKQYVRLWIKEWSMYSKALMQKAQVTKIVFCEKLALDGQIRAAVPAYDLNTMYYDPALGSYAPGYQRGVVHHEFFHMMDHRMRKSKSDPDWTALNPKDFKYGSGGKNMRTSGAGNLTTEIPGFLTPYATSAIEEDKAELYSHLIVDAGFVLNLAKKDAVLAAKIAFLKKRMMAYDPFFGPNFWPKP